MKASELSHRLGENAFAVCKYYLSNGHKAGRYWQVGNAQNEKGKSLFVRLAAPGTQGKWQDSATDEHGDLLDIIKLSCGLPDLASAMIEARRFLRLSPPPPPRSMQVSKRSNYTDIARRLYAAGRSMAGTLGEVYLGKRGLSLCSGMGALRFHPRAWFDKYTYHPAIIAAVRDNAGNITGINRMFLDSNANLIERRALGHLNGYAVRIGPLAPDRLLIGEGLESTLSFTVTYPKTPLVAALSSAHMAAFIIPKSVRHLIIAADNDPAGRAAAARLESRAKTQGILVRVIYPNLGDFNDDLVKHLCSSLPLAECQGKVLARHCS